MQLLYEAMRLTLAALGLRRQPPAAPALTIDATSLRAGSQQVLDPQAIGFVNSGSAPAFNVRYEIRKYYDALLWRNFECRSREIVPAVLSGKGFQVEWTPGHDDPEVARFFTWEVRVQYEQQDGASFLSFASIGMVGQLTRHSHAAGWVRRRVLPLETWSRHFFPSLLLNAKIMFRELRTHEWVQLRRCTMKFPVDMYHGTREFVNELRGHGLDARSDLFNGQVGVIVGPRGLDPGKLPPDTKALFFPLWEINAPANRQLVENLDFLELYEKRPPGWTVNCRRSA